MHITNARITSLLLNFCVTGNVSITRVLTLNCFGESDLSSEYGESFAEV